MTRRREGTLLLRACQRTAARIEQWRRELEARGPLQAADERLLDEWIRWNIHRETDARMLLCPRPLVRTLRQRADGSWERVGWYARIGNHVGGRPNR